MFKKKEIVKTYIDGELQQRQNEAREEMRIEEEDKRIAELLGEMPPKREKAAEREKINELLDFPQKILPPPPPLINNVLPMVLLVKIDLDGNITVARV